MKAISVSFETFCSISLLSLANGCVSPSQRDPSSAQQASSARGAADAAALSERARLAASGRLITVTSQAALDPALATIWGDALDIPEELVTEVTLIGPPQASDVRGPLGVIQPLQGPTFGMLSTGIADPSLAPEPGTDFDELGVAGDSVTLKLTLKVPAGVNRMSLQYNFLSSESPDFIGTNFNDTFSIQLIDDGIARPVEDLASVNASQFFESSQSRADGTGYDIYIADPSGIDSDFGDVGLPDAGLTDFQSFHTAVTSGSQLEVLLTIADNGDGILDSAVLIDALQFSAIETLDPNPALVQGDGALVTNEADLATKGRPVRGAAADGATQVLLRMKVAAAGMVEFSLPGGADDGALTVVGATRTGAGQAVLTRSFVVGQEYFVVAAYHAPTDFNGDATQRERSIAIRATFTSDRGAVLETSVSFQVLRPPLVMAHGLWSSSLDWLKRNGDGSLKFPLVGNPAFAITYSDRSYACTNELRDVIPQDNIRRCPLTLADPGEGEPLCITLAVNPIGAATLEALANIRRLGIAATQVDVVAHGAGGVDVRKYLDDEGYKKNPLNFKLGDVNRLITINTAHRGSAVAALVVRARDRTDPPPSVASRVDFICANRVTIRRPIDPGDIDDISPASLQLLESDVPGHAIVGTGARNIINIQERRNKASLARALYSDVIRRLSLSFSADILRDNSPAFGTAEHDLFSSISSQQGGLGAAETTPFAMDVKDDPVDQVDSDFFHSIGEGDISARVEQLLNSPIAGGAFGTFASTQPPQQPPATPSREQSAIVPPASLVGGTLRILSPAFGDEVVAGSTLDVVVVAEGGFAPQSIAVMTEGALTSVDTAGSGPFTIQLKIPADSLGPIRLLAIGTDAADDLVYNDVALIARTTANLTGVSIVTQNPYLFGAGARRQLAVLGRYDDGVARDLTSNINGTIYRSSNIAIVDVTPQGTLVALGSGVATVVAQNGLSQDSITVTVLLNAAPLVVASGGTSLTCLPPGSQASVQLDGSQSFDPDGDPLTYSWLEDGVLIATGPTPTIQLGPGPHTIELQVADGQGGFASASVNVSVALDSEPPALAVLGADPSVVECGIGYDDTGATAQDVCDGDLTGAIVAQSNVDPGAPGSYAVSYTVQDQVGLAAIATRAVLVEDTQPPQLALLGESPTLVQCGTSFTDPGATSTDGCAGELTDAITAESDVDATSPGSYVVSYRVEDPSGRVTTETRAVQVQDSDAPELTVLGDNPKVVECGATYVDEGATAIDRCDGELTFAIISQSDVDASVPGPYQVSYQVEDRARLSATAARAVSVVDRTPPEVSVAPMIQLSPPFLFLRRFHLSDCVSAVDTCGGPADVDRLGEIVAIHSDEPDRSFRWDPGHDIVITGTSSFLLRQQRKYPGNGRVYEVEFTVGDENGNRGPVQSCFVGVKTTRYSPTPINDGRVYTVVPHTN